MERADQTEHRERRPVVVGCDGESAKFLGHDADDLERDPIDEHVATENGRVARKQPVPSAVTQDHHRLSRGWFIVGRRQRASHRGADAHHPEEVARDERAKHQTPVDEAVDLGPLRVGVGEDVGLTTERVVLLARETHAFAVGSSRPLDGEHLMHVGHRIDAKQQCVEHREHRGDQAEPERHRGDDGEGDERSALERAQRVDDVADRVVDEGGAARVATLLPDLINATERPERLKARSVGGQATRPQPLGIPFEMKLQFLRQIRFTAIAE